MGGFGMNPEALYAGGTSVAALEGDAAAASRAFLEAVHNAGGAVRHPTLVTALEAYHGTWSTPANQLPRDIETVGNKISTTAVTGAQADNDTQSEVTTSGTGVLELFGLVSRPINVLAGN